MIKLCLDCKWSVQQEQDKTVLECVNPRVTRYHAETLSSSKRNCGPGCYAVRQESWPFEVCGLKGKRWEPKENKND